MNTSIRYTASCIQTLIVNEAAYSWQYRLRSKTKLLTLVSLLTSLASRLPHGFHPRVNNYKFKQYVNRSDKQPMVLLSALPFYLMEYILGGSYGKSHTYRSRVAAVMRISFITSVARAKYITINMLKPSGYYTYHHV